MHVLGIDFGTSNTVAVLRSADGRVRPLLFDGAPILPSAVYYNSDGRMLVGRDAERNARMDPSRFEPNPKRRIDDGSVFLGTSEIPVPQVFAYVLQQVALDVVHQLRVAIPPEESQENTRGLILHGFTFQTFQPSKPFSLPTLSATFGIAFHSAFRVSREYSIAFFPRAVI
jgi:hypothetical protein